MSDDGPASELLLRWQQARAEGELLSAEEVCHNAPGELSEVRTRIETLLYMESLLGVDGEGSATRLQDSSPARTGGGDVPEEMPGYEVIELIDRGGMGAVYRARQRELNRFVALKMLSGTHAAAERVARFRTEAESVAQLHHPNIVQIFDVGEVDGRPFYSMELVEGGSLARRLEGDRMSPREAAELVETLARGIAIAHARDIVHRDLKPGNVLIAEDGTPKIADFGLAKRLGDDSNQTKTGEILGTPSYMAPEQAEGRAAEIGPAVDVYALGAILFELLTGEPPFKGETAMESLRRLTTEDAQLPRESRGVVPKDLEAITLKCLEKSPGDRYATADDLADDLRRYLDGHAIHARRIGLMRRIFKWCRRRPEWAVVAGIAFIGVVATIVWASAEYRENRRRREEAVRLAPQAREILKRNCYECHGEKTDDIARNLDVLNHDSLVGNSRRIVVAEKPDDSRLIQRIADGSMPPESDEIRLPRVSQQELDILRKWIAGGAPAFPSEDPASPTPPVVPYSQLAMDVKGILVRRCYECHKTDVAEGGIKILHHRLLLTVRKVVVPNDAANSELYQLITASPGDKLLMPPVPAKRLTADEIATIRRWINSGAPPFPKGVPPK